MLLSARAHVGRGPFQRGTSICAPTTRRSRAGSHGLCRVDGYAYDSNIRTYSWYLLTLSCERPLIVSVRLVMSVSAGHYQPGWSCRWFRVHQLHPRRRMLVHTLCSRTLGLPRPVVKDRGRMSVVVSSGGRRSAPRTERAQPIGTDRATSCRPAINCSSSAWVGTVRPALSAAARANPCCSRCSASSSTADWQPR